MPKGYSRFSFTLRYIFNIMRTWYIFHIRFPWVKYTGFVRVMAHTGFAKRNITIGNNVQFGKYCSVISDLTVGNNVLIAGRVSFIGKHDHITHIPCCTIWDSPRGDDDITIVKDDVWIGHNSTIIAGVKIHEGAVVAAGSLVTKDIPPCEIWGGVPAKKIKDRFASEDEKNRHLNFLKATLQ